MNLYRPTLSRHTTAHAALLLLLAAVLPLLGGCANIRWAHSQPPSVLYIADDDIAPGDLACYGSTLGETPNLDSLAADGMRFTRAYATAPAGAPSFVAALTGKYPARLGLTDATDPRPAASDRTHPLLEPAQHTALSRDEPTVPRAFGSAGFEPALFGKWDLSTTPLPLGFDTYQPDSEALGSRPDQNPDRNARLTALAERFLDENGKRRPFFLCVRYHTALPPKPDLLRHYTERSDAALQTAEPAFRAARTADLDANVGRLLSKIDDLNLRRKVLVVFAPDSAVPNPAPGHAPANPAPERTAGALAEAHLRVPLIVRWPEVTPAGSVSDGLVSTVDHAATLLEACQLDPKTVGLPATDGASFAGILRGAPAGNRPPICWHYPHYGAGAPAAAVRSGDWKLVEFYDDQHVALYHLADDPGETKDLAAAQPEKVSELRDLLNRWRTAVGAKMPTKNPAYH